MASSRTDYTDGAEEIYLPHENEQKLQMESTRRDELKKGITDVRSFLQEEPTSLTEYDEPLVCRNL